MPFGLKNAPSEFQKVMNDIFNPYTTFLTVYIDDVLIFSQNIEQHFKHLKTFIHVVKKNGLVISNKKTSLFQTKIRFLVHYVHHGTIKPIARAIQFAKKFPDQVINKTQLQRFLGSLNYVVDFIPNLSVLCKPLHDRLKKNPPPWSEKHSNTARQIKKQVNELPCLHLIDSIAFEIFETDASDISYGGILKQRKYEKEQVVQFT